MFAKSRTIARATRESRELGTTACIQYTHRARASLVPSSPSCSSSTSTERTTVQRNILYPPKNENELIVQRFAPRHCSRPPK